jgi:hypothetical protein
LVERKANPFFKPQAFKQDDLDPTSEGEGWRMNTDRVFAIKFSSVYPLYIQKVESKKRTKKELDQVLCWLTGYTLAGLKQQIKKENDLKAFFAQAPAMHPNTSLITGVVCGIRVEEIKDPLMRNIRYMDKLIDELAKGRKMEKILRQAPASTSG